MPWKEHPDLWGFIGAIIISLISGFIAVANRITGGHAFSLMWFVAQISGSVLAGYLMWDMYPVVKDSLPAWATMPVMVSVSAHYGGKVFSLAEKIFLKRFNLPDNPA